jgi:hypothetical protein
MAPGRRKKAAHAKASDRTISHAVSRKVAFHCNVFINFILAFCRLKTSGLDSNR